MLFTAAKGGLLLIMVCVSVPDVVKVILQHSEACELQETMATTTPLLGTVYRCVQGYELLPEVASKS